MPQIAQQDYNKIVINGASIKDDANAMYLLACQYERGTVFDTVIVIPATDEARECNIRITSIIGTGPSSVGLNFLDSRHPTRIGNISLDHPSRTYRVLAKMQAETGTYPVLMYDEENHLTDNGTPVVVDGFYIAVTVDEDDVLTGVQITDQKAIEANTVEITEEDAFDLIGMFVGN